MTGSLEERIDRLESIEAIRQLVAKYALSLDMRDLDAHVNLFAPDIQVGRGRVGRSHLKRWLDDTLRLQFTGTSHHTGNHIIEFNDADHAHGALYSKNEHETDGEDAVERTEGDTRDECCLDYERLKHRGPLLVRPVTARGTPPDPDPARCPEAFR